MILFTTLVGDLFRLAQEHVLAGGAGDGRAFELRVGDYMMTAGVRPATVFSGVRSLGSFSMSGLYHQIDATGTVHDAVVIGEWKAYRGLIPKNDLIRFKAVTDDYWMAQHQLATAPVMRVFGGTGFVSTELRRYAAQWGICLITPDRWPTPILASETTSWPNHGPNRLVRRYLAWLARPLATVCAPQPDGAWLIPRPPSAAALDHFLALQDDWSARRWQRTGAVPGDFQAWIRAGAR